MPVVSPALLAVVDQVRAIAGPTIANVIPSTLSITTRTWAAGRRGTEGGFIDSVLTLPTIYFFRQLKTFEITGSGGRYEEGDMLLGPITPSYNNGLGAGGANNTGIGGFTEAQLIPPGSSDGIEVFYKITGNHQGEYQLVELRSTDPIAYWLVLRRRRSTPQVV